METVPRTPPSGGQPGFTDNVMIVAVVALFGSIVLLISLHVYARFFWRNRRSAPGTTPASMGVRRRPHLRRFRTLFTLDWVEEEEENPDEGHLGLDGSVLENLPTFIFTSGGGGAAAARERLTCSVCLEEFIEGEKGRILPKCTHLFHVGCIDMWFHSHTTCPLCRCDVGPDPIESLYESISYVPTIEQSPQAFPFSDFPRHPVSSSSHSDLGPSTSRKIMLSPFGETDLDYKIQLPVSRNGGEVDYSRYQSEAQKDKDRSTSHGQTYDVHYSVSQSNRSRSSVDVANEENVIDQSNQARPLAIREIQSNRSRPSIDVANEENVIDQSNPEASALVIRGITEGSTSVNNRDEDCQPGSGIVPLTHSYPGGTSAYNHNYESILTNVADCEKRAQVCNLEDRQGITPPSKSYCSDNCCQETPPHKTYGAEDCQKQERIQVPHKTCRATEDCQEHEITPCKTYERRDHDGATISSSPASTQLPETAVSHFCPRSINEDRDVTVQSCAPGSPVWQSCARDDNSPERNGHARVRSFIALEIIRSKEIADDLELSR